MADDKPKTDKTDKTDAEATVEVTEVVKPGKYVELGYDLYEKLPDGGERLVHQTDGDDPERIVFGVTKGVIEPLEKALEGLAPGDKFDVTATADQAFGPHDPEQVVTLSRDIFMVDGKFDAEHIRPEAIVPMMTAEGYRINGRVVKVTDNDVTMDFNHPLAGKSVRFDGLVLRVRDATPDELQPATGCSGCHGSCDCDEAGDCGDGSCQGCH